MLNKLFLAIALLCSFLCNAQLRFGNEWIDFSKQYYKILIAKDGIYRINQQALIQAGLPLSTINPKNFQLYHLGKEQAIYIDGENDGQFDANDFIEFYGEHNDGKTDTELFGSAPQVNPYYSFVSDTSAYFLCWSSITPGQRLSLYSNISYSSFTPRDYYIHHSRYFGSYSAAATDFNYNYGIPSTSVYGSEYSANEGYSSSWAGIGGPLTIPLATDNYYKQGPKPVLNTWLSGVSNAIHSISFYNHYVQLWLGNFKVFEDSLLGFYSKPIVNAIIDTSALFANTTALQLKVLNIYVTADWNTIPSADLAYPRTFELNSFSTWLYDLDATQQFVSWNNYGTGVQTNPVIYDFTNNYRVSGTVSGTNLKIIFPSTTQAKKIYMSDSTDIQYIGLAPVNFVNVNAASNYDYLIITHKNFLQEANNYETYNATRYQNFNTLVVTSNEIYDEFYYGLHHPLAVRHFCDYILENSTTAPKYLLLMGKGEQTNVLRDPFNYSLDFVPSIGVPSSDNMFTAGLKGSQLYEPAIATGRVACKTAAEASNYLQKLKDYESLSDTTYWKKNILHLLGGDDIQQSNTIAYVMNTDAGVIKNPFYGASVTTFNKNSTSPIDSSLEQKIQNTINQGLGLMTFFGHGSLNETDIKFGDGCQLNNYKKYPIMYMNGCNVGNANLAYQFNSSQNKCPGSNPGNIASKGEVFLLEKDKGAIVWLAQSNTSTLSTLSRQIDTVYSLLAKDAFGESFGNIIKQMVRRTQAAGPTSADIRNHSLQLIYQGDPAVRLFYPSLPDYKITNNSLFLYPFNANAVSDSFAIGINITNYGKAVKDSIQLRVKRTYGSTIVDFTGIKIKAPLLNDTFYYYIKSKDIRTTGSNKFEVWIDEPDKIAELNELNNFASLSFYMPGNGVNLISPVKYAIADSANIELVAQSSNLFATTDAEFYFELDTNPYFNSFMLQQSALIKAKHLAKWKLSLPLKDSIVYYWRARLNLADTAGGYWLQQSFTYIKNSSEGWNQSHFLQYTGIESSDMIIDTLTRSIKFYPIKRSLKVNTQRYAHCNRGFILDGYQGGLNSGVSGGQATNLIVMEFNQYNLDPELSYIHPQAGYPVSYLQFNTTLAGMQDSFMRYINNVKDGQYVGIYTRYNPNITSWDTAMFTTIEKLGFPVTKARGINWDYTSFVAVGQKGGGQNGFVPIDDTLRYVAGLPQGCGINPDSLNPILEISAMLVGSDTKGSMSSEIIGPANSWSEVYRNYTSKEINPRDTITIDIIGIAPDKSTETVLFSGIGPDSFAINSINAKKYPFLKLIAHLSDIKNHTAPIFLGWQVRYEGIPEGSIDPSNPKYPFVMTKDTMNDGDTLQLKFAFINISSHNFKSPLFINYTISDINKGYKQKVKFFTDSINTLLNAGDTFYIEKMISTRSLGGNNILDVFVNEQVQPEASYTNNNFSKPFYIISDKTPPILDVTFDGIHIRNNEIVAPSPVILITVKDENKTLLMNDTSNLVILLTRPNASVADTIRFTDPNILFVPATNTKLNKAVLEYSPKNLSDGVYNLKVQAYDRAGNISGANMYEIAFEVITKQTTTRFYPYPNPFSTAMHFVFTITGKVPDNIYVQIFTVSGKIVKTVTKSEMGMLHVGSNITDWAWDGTDEFGDRLANGVYLYKVFIQEDGTDVEINKNLGLLKNEKYFVKDFGKIYILR